MIYNKITLSFPEKEERLFLKQYFFDSIMQFRVAFVLVITLYALFGFLDLKLVPDDAHYFFIIRYLFVIPILSVVLILSFTKFFQKCWQVLLLISFIIGGTGISIMTMLVPENYAYYAGLMLIFSAGYFFIKLRFFLATIAGWSTLIIFNIGAIFYADANNLTLLGNNFFFISANLIGMLAAYNIEYQTRYNFFLNQKLDKEKQLVEDTNKNLEIKVADRTKELLKAKEIAEENEKTLKNINERFELATKTAVISVWEHDFATNIIKIDDNFNTIYGRNQANYQLEFTEFAKFIQPDDVDKLNRNIKKAIKSDESTDFEFKIVRSDGEIRCIKAYCKAIKDSITNKPIKLIGVNIDITERKMAEEILKNSEARFKNMFERHSAIMLLIEPKSGKIIEANKASVQFYGYSKSKLLSMNINEINVLTPEQVKKERELAHNKEKNYFVFPHRLANGEKRIVEVHSTPINFQNNEILFSIIHDISERHLAEQKLKDSEAKLKEINSTKDKFFSIVTHDLKNPFNIIVGFSSLLSEQVKKNNYDAIVKYADIIHQSSYHAMDLLSNLMEWSHSQTGRLEFNPEHFEFLQLINETELLLSGAIKQKSIAFSINISSNIVVFADLKMISTVLRNLISNAIKFTHAGGEINITVEKNKESILVSVSDNGIGISKDNIRKLFRIDQNYTTKGTNKEKGTGLGLILCKEFIEKHQGKIWVESEIGKGSLFRFTLPNQ